MPRIRLGYANVMSTIAVFIALGGTSYAVSRLPRNSVGNAQLRSGAVTSSKVRDGSIATRDLASNARGARGPRGATGPAGPPGPGRAPSIIVRTRDEDAARPGLGGGSYVTVLTAALPAGRWLVSATTQATNFPSSPSRDILRCFIAVDGARRGLGKVLDAGTIDRAVSTDDLYLTEVVETQNAAAVSLSCGHDGDVPAGSDLRFDRSKIVAIPVESADLQAVTG